MSDKDWKHPELQEEEVFLGYGGLTCFRILGWKTKRRGIVAYDTQGNPLQKKDFFPIFVHRSEMKEANLSGKMIDKYPFKIDLL